ncbi:hypothetical protein NEHOM01_2519, partial [Nematocida homosporus]|uniref:uncharacterized protein n=1 Tax=Nematocida homosporus TaxID=1912981 RepID=UPI00221FAF4B
IRKGMLGMSLKLVLAWLCCVMVWLSVVLGSSDSSTNSDEMELSPGVELSTETACLLGESNPCIERNNFDLYGLDNPNNEISEHQIRNMKERMTACLEWMYIFQPLVGDQLIESRNLDGSIGWILEMNSKKDQIQMVEDMQAEELIGYLSELEGIPGVREVADMYASQLLKITTTNFSIPPTSGPTLNPTSTNPNKETITYKQCLEVLKPLKKITNSDRLWIAGKSTENEILDQLELLLFLLRIADSLITTIYWIDMSKVLFDPKSIDSFRPLLKDIPAKLKERKLAFDIATSCNHVFWNAFLDLLGENYNIKMKHVRDYWVVSLNANPT